MQDSIEGPGFTVMQGGWRVEVWDGYHWDPSQPFCSSSLHYSTELVCILTYWFANDGIFRWIEIGLKSNASVCNY